MATPELIDDHYCIACGMDNKDGLLIEWKIDGRRTTAEFTPQRKHQGWKDIVHGGVLATLLDEAMTRLAYVVCGGALTAEMTVRYLQTARVGEKIYIEGEILSENRKLVEMRAALYRDRPGGPVIARSTGKAVKLKLP